MRRRLRKPGECRVGEVVPLPDSSRHQPGDPDPSLPENRATWEELAEAARAWGHEHEERL